MGLQIELLRESFEAAVEAEGLVTTRFYELLFERYPAVRPLFSRHDPARQQKMLQESLLAVLDRVEDGAWLTETLGNMGRQHIDYEVTEEMYPWVGECLIAALAEVLGDRWTDAHEQAWTEAYWAISGFMIEGARKAALEASAS